MGSKRDIYYFKCDDKTWLGGNVAMYMRHGVPIKWHIPQNYTFT